MRIERKWESESEILRSGTPRKKKNLQQHGIEKNQDQGLILASH